MTNVISEATEAYNTGDYISALRGFRKAVLEHPHSAALYRFKALSESRVGQQDAARESAQKSTLLDPDDSENWFVLGIVSLPDKVAAVEAFARAHDLNPSHSSAGANAVALLRELSRHEEAMAVRQKGMKAGVTDVRFLMNSALVLKDLGDVSGAALELEHLLKANPSDPDILINLANCKRQLGDIHKAQKFAEQALELAPNSAAAHACLAGVFELTHHNQKAYDLYVKARDIEPNNPAHWHNMGSVLNALGDFTASGEALERAMALGALGAKTRVNLGYVRLWQGALKEGWDLYESRFEAGTAKPNRQPGKPRWIGEPTHGKTLLLWGEQGLGDEISFAHCVPDVQKAVDGPVILECEPRLVSLFQRSFPWAKVRSRTCDDLGHELNTNLDFDLHCPTGSLKQIYRSSLSDFPSSARPILKPDPALVLKWQTLLDSLGPGLRVGLCWRSGMSGGLRGQGLHLQNWQDVLSLQGVHWISLQYGDVAADMAWAKDQNISLQSWPHFDPKDDQEDVAALIQNCDLVISDNTAVAHMAGALERPCWTVTFDTMWSRHGTDRRPQYVNTDLKLRSVLTPFTAWCRSVLRPELEAWIQS